MKVLVACEFSGIVRDAFAAMGHDAWSCDLLPSERPSNRHYQMNVLDLLAGRHHDYPAWPGYWDLMIAHPPCTYLAVSGARWWANRQQEQLEALAFVYALANAPIPRICIENPVSLLSTAWRKPDQIIQPWQFGHTESKRTCLWLKGLPLLLPTAVMERRTDNLTPSGQNKLGPGPNRQRNRGRTYTGIAAAMAEQWGTHIAEELSR